MPHPGPAASSRRAGGGLEVARTDRVVLVAAMAVLAACAGPQDPPGDPAPIPVTPVPLTSGPLTPAPGVSVVVVSIDALRSDHLGAYGSEAGLTPRLDAFAAEAAVFVDSRASASTTPISFAALWTGRYPHRVLRGWHLETEETLAALFAAAGYETAAFVSNPQLAVERRFDRGWGHYGDHPGVPDEELSRRALDWLDAREGGRPSLLWLHWMAPHTPYREAPPGFPAPACEGVRTGDAQPPIVDEIPDLDCLRTLYAGEVVRTDRLFGNLLDALEERGLSRSTIVAVTADHGEALGDEGRFVHGRLGEGVLEVPLLVRSPGGAAGVGRRVAGFVSHLDLLPTLAGLAGVPDLRPRDGRDLAAAMERRAPAGPAVADRAPVSAVALSRGRWSGAALVRPDGLKLIRACSPEAGLRLYDLATDPREARDLAEDRPEEAAELLAELAAALGEAPCRVVRPRQPAAEGLSAETRAALEALGYLDPE